MSFGQMAEMIATLTAQFSFIELVASEEVFIFLYILLAHCFTNLRTITLEQRPNTYWSWIEFDITQEIFGDVLSQNQDYSIEKNVPRHGEEIHIFYLNYNMITLQ